MILEDLWSGRFYPAETVVPTDPKYREVNREISEKMESLQAQLPQEQFTLVEQVLEQTALAHSMELESHFCFGFAAGIRLQQEIEVLLLEKQSYFLFPGHNGSRTEDGA